MAVSVAVCKIFSVNEWCELENRVRVRYHQLDLHQLNGILALGCSRHTKTSKIIKKVFKLLYYYSPQIQFFSDVVRLINCYIILLVSKIISVLVLVSFLTLFLFVYSLVSKDFLVLV